MYGGRSEVLYVQRAAEAAPVAAGDGGRCSVPNT